MQSTDANYKALIGIQHEVEAKLDIYTADGTSLVHSFDTDMVKEIKVTNSLFVENTVSVGGATSGEIDVTLRKIPDGVTIPRMAMLKPYVRLTGYVSGAYTVSDWLPKGIFWIDTREVDYVTKDNHFHGYDAMLKAEQMNSNTSTNSATLLTHICSTMGVQLDPRNPVLVSFTVDNSILFTFREILRMIAAYNGGNWTFAPNGKLLFLPLNGLPTETYLLVDNSGNRITFGGVGILTEAVNNG